MVSAGFDDRPVYPYESESVFDGDRTIRHDKRAHFATIYAGNAMESRPSPDLACGYTFFMWPLPSTLRFAKTIERTEVNGKPLVRIVLPSDRTPDRVTTLWLDPAAGFLIVRAEGRDGQGRLFSERVETETKQAGGAWFLTRGTDHLWAFKGEEKRTLESISWTATFATVNQNVAPQLLELTLPPGTLVRDDRTGSISKAPAAPAEAPQMRPAGVP